MSSLERGQCTEQIRNVFQARHSIWWGAWKRMHVSLSSNTLSSFSLFFLASPGLNLECHWLSHGPSHKSQDVNPKVLTTFQFRQLHSASLVFCKDCHYSNVGTPSQQLPPPQDKKQIFSMGSWPEASSDQFDSTYQDKSFSRRLGSGPVSYFRGHRFKSCWGCTFNKTSVSFQGVDNRHWNTFLTLLSLNLQCPARKGNR